MLGVTATPIRLDKMGLVRHADGVFDKLIVGPSLRELIDDGFLTDYKIFAPRTDVDLSSVPISQVTGDYSQPKLRAVMRKSKIVGDVVSQYLRIAPGKLGVTFAPDVELAHSMAKQFNNSYIPAAVISAKTPNTDRISIMDKFRRREFLQLVNVDIVGEGVDLPAIEVVIMTGATKSLARYVQQFGRALRPMIADGVPFATREQRLRAIAASEKPHAIIIDHVGNVVDRHNIPDIPRMWSLDAGCNRRASRDDQEIALRECPQCTQPYLRVNKACPYCGFKPVPQARSSPEQVDGDLVEMDAEALSALRNRISVVDEGIESYRQRLIDRGAPGIGVAGHTNRHRRWQESQSELRDAIALWGGYQRSQGNDDSESYRRFYLKFGVDVLSAQSLKEKEADALADTVRAELRTLIP